MNPRVDELDQVADKIERHINAAVERWHQLPDKTLLFRPSENDWSAKEIIGHLIDSASNNHQRFVRLQLTDRLDFPDYGQDNIHWVKIQSYQHHPWHDLLGLWRYFNLQLARIIRAQTSITLFDLMTDYLRHLENHLDQLADTIEAFKKS